jgi:magnesium-transporting ATPase (P-type)
MHFLNGVNEYYDAHELLENLRSEKIRLFTFPFDQRYKRMVTVYAISPDEARIVVKGAPEVIGELTN